MAKLETGYHHHVLTIRIQLLHPSSIFAAPIRHFVPRILRIINRLNLGGPTYNAALLTHYLQPEFETLLVTGSRQSTEESSDFILNDLGITHLELPEMSRSIHPWNDFKAYRKLRSIIREFKPDIIHTHAAKAGALGRLAAFAEGVPVTVHTFHGHVFHSYFQPFKTKIFLMIERALAKRSSAIIAISAIQKEELAGVYSLCKPEKIKVVPLGFDLARFQENIEIKREKFRSNYFLEKDEIAIGIIGRLVPVKNHPLFIHAAAELVKRTNKKIRFFIIGDGEERSNLIQLCKELRLDYSYAPLETKKADLTFCSWIREIDVAISGMDIVTLTSFNEGTPVSLIEAQAGNKPIVSTNVGGIENIVSPGKTALLVNNNDKEAFIKSVLELIESETLRKELASGGWEYVRTRFHYSILVQNMRSVYKQLLAVNYDSH